MFIVIIPYVQNKAHWQAPLNHLERLKTYPQFQVFSFKFLLKGDNNSIKF